MARKVLTEYHPLEPEMWLQLGSHEHRQVLMAGVVRKLVVKAPDWLNVPTEKSWEATYTKCAWRSEDYCLLHYLRLGNKNGQKRKNARRVCWRTTSTDNGWCSKCPSAASLGAVSPRRLSHADAVPAEAPRLRRSERSWSSRATAGAGVR